MQIKPLFKRLLKYALFYLQSMFLLVVLFVTESQFAGSYAINFWGIFSALGIFGLFFGIDYFVYLRTQPLQQTEQYDWKILIGIFCIAMIPHNFSMFMGFSRLYLSVAFHAISFLIVFFVYKQYIKPLLALLSIIFILHVACSIFLPPMLDVTLSRANYLEYFLFDNLLFFHVLYYLAIFLVYKIRIYLQRFMIVESV